MDALFAAVLVGREGRAGAVGAEEEAGAVGGIGSDGGWTEMVAKYCAKDTARPG